MVGDNSLVPTLRILTSIELYINATFYSQHPCFLSVMNEHGKYFRLKNLLPLCVSKDCLDSNLTEDDLVRKEAILNCSSHKWSSFLCILGLSSILGMNISTYYPDCGELQYKIFFNHLITPRKQDHSVDSEAIHLLFCFVLKALLNLAKPFSLTTLFLSFFMLTE